VYRLESVTGGLRKVRYDQARACQELTAADARLAKLMQRSGPFAMRLKPTHHFEALLGIDRVPAIAWTRGESDPWPDSGIVPRSHAHSVGLLRLGDPGLRGAGLSASKLLAIRDLAEKSEAGIVPPLTKLHRMADEEICARLTTVRGIGVWTVQMLLIFRMGRPNVLPVSDYGVRKGFALTFGKLRPGDPVTRPIFLRPM